MMEHSYDELIACIEADDQPTTTLVNLVAESYSAGVITEPEMAYLTNNIARRQKPDKASRVFLLEATDKDVTAAKRFGSIVHLFPDNRPRPSIWDPKIMQSIQLRLDNEHFDPSSDYLIALGAQALFATTIHFMSQTYSSYRVLFYHAALKTYVVRYFEGNQQ